MVGSITATRSHPCAPKKFRASAMDSAGSSEPSDTGCMWYSYLVMGDVFAWFRNTSLSMNSSISSERQSAYTATSESQIRNGGETMKPRKDSADRGAGSGCMARLVRCSSFPLRGAVSFESVMTLAVVAALIVGVTLGIRVSTMLPLRQQPQGVPTMKQATTSQKPPENGLPR